MPGRSPQPFTGSGVFKGVNNALELASALETHSSIDGALSEWSQSQTAAAKRLVILGEQMEQAWIWTAADFSTMAAEETAEWWNNAVKFPDEFSYSDDR